MSFYRRHPTYRTETLINSRRLPTGDILLSARSWHSGLHFTDYGRLIFGKDAVECIYKALVKIKQAIHAHWTDADIPIARNLFFRSGRA